MLGEAMRERYARWEASGSEPFPGLDFVQQGESGVDKCRCGAEWDLHTGTSETMVGFSSPPGHDHDDNCRKRTYICKAGHRATLSIRRTCPSCDWRGKETCFCHDGEKVDSWPDGVPLLETWEF